MKPIIFLDNPLNSDNLLFEITSDRFVEGIPRTYRCFLQEYKISCLAKSKTNLAKISYFMSFFSNLVEFSAISMAEETVIILARILRNYYISNALTNLNNDH